MWQRSLTTLSRSQITFVDAKHMSYGHVYNGKFPNVLVTVNVLTTEIYLLIRRFCKKILNSLILAKNNK